MSKPIYVEHDGWRAWFSTSTQEWSVEFAVERNGHKEWFLERKMPTEMLSNELREAIEHYRPGQLAILEASND